jgi:hypothetical protein
MNLRDQVGCRIGRFPVSFKSNYQKSMNHYLRPYLIAATLCGGTAHGAEVTLNATTIPNSNTSPQPYSWTTADGKMTFTDSSGGYAAGEWPPGSYYAGSTFGNNGAAYDNGDSATVSLAFTESSGLRSIITNYSRFSAVISGFVADPGVTLTGGYGNRSATYDPVNKTVTISHEWNGDSQVYFNFANPGASAGQTLVLAFASDIGGGSGYQYSLNKIVYQDAEQAPVIATGLPAITNVAEGGSTTFSVALAAGALPLANYKWEFDSLPIDGSYTLLGTDPTYTASNATANSNGNYRVTVSNTVGTVDSTTTLEVKSDNDNDGLLNIYETGTGIYVSPSDTGTAPSNPDTDGDGLKDGAEVLTNLTNPNLVDTDGDGLSDGAEVNTHLSEPLVTDTDADGLSDGAEVNTHSSSPITFDSDGDGYSDGWEIQHTASNPSDPASPNVGSGRNSIGVQFASPNGDRPGYTLGSLAYAGAPNYVQKNWNITSTSGNPNGSELDIVTPSSAVLVDSRGNTTATLLGFGANYKWGAGNERQTPYGRLYSGYLDSNESMPNVDISLNDIPYARYDVVVYVGSGGNDRTGTVRLNGLDDYAYTGMAVQEDGLEPTYVRTTDSSLSFTGQRFRPAANVVIFRGVTGASMSLTHIRGSYNGGVFAVQVVEDLDTDGDGMGDAYEASNGLNVNLNDATADLDNDGLGNLLEHDLGTYPNRADSDGDGLQDGNEWNTLLTQPFLSDTDGDGLADGAEVNTHLSDPLDTDSDDDGYLDGYEVNTISSNPGNANSPGGPNPLGVGIAFNNYSGEQTGYAFSPSMYAGADAVRQKNWNRTYQLPTENLTGTEVDIAQPIATVIADSTGTATAITLAFKSSGVWSDYNEQKTPYGHLYNAFAYNSGDAPDVEVSLGNIPYAAYDVYVYMGADWNGRTGSVSNGSTIYSFTSSSNATSNGGLSSYVETTSADGYPNANYCVFRNQSGNAFSFKVSRGSDNVGLFGLQVVQKSPSPDYSEWATANAGGQATGLDFDGDGLSNGVEYLMGESGSGFTSNPAPINGKITWPKNPAANATYVVQTSTHLAAEGEAGGWTTASAGVVDNGSSIEYTLPTGQGKLFTRLKVTVP